MKKGKGNSSYSNPQISEAPHLPKLFIRPDVFFYMSKASQQLLESKFEIRFDKRQKLIEEFH